MLEEFTKSQRLTILDYSASFGAMFGPSIEMGFSLSNWIKTCDLRKFCEFANAVTDNYLENSSLQMQEEQLEIEIHPPNLKPSKLYISAHVKVKLAVSQEDVERIRNCEDFPLLAILSHCEWKVG